ncbi:kinase [Streptococcus merionis]|uniref:GHMP family kinase ATP-binding protein n=1 Tax=Streptococcus merionis TaxID=400065 RepID=UPI0026EAC854|nr:kinase [Streptococcus merionis]
MSDLLVSCPGSCGELFQCVVAGREYLMSYNIEEKSYARISSNQESRSQLGDKAKQAVELLAIPSADSRKILSYTDLPVGKGYSSSTADMVAAVQATSLYYQKKSLSASQLTSICAKIEPSDSVAFQNWTVIDALSGEAIWQTTWQPELYVYMLEPIESLDTQDMSRMTESDVYPKQQSASLFSLFQEACTQKSLTKLGQLATLSAHLNNERLPKPYLNEIVELATNHKAIGVNVAHSGTVVGVLFSRQQMTDILAFENVLANHVLSTYYQERRLRKILFEGVQQVRK